MLWIGPFVRKYLNCCCSVLKLCHLHWPLSSIMESRCCVFLLTVIKTILGQAMKAVGCGVSQWPPVRSPNTSRPVDFVCPINMGPLSPKSICHPLPKSISLHEWEKQWSLHFIMGFSALLFSELLHLIQRQKKSYWANCKKHSNVPYHFCFNF